MTSKQIEIAVSWWADKLKGCKNSGLSPEERKDRSNDGYQMAELMMNASRPKVTDEQIRKFSGSLTQQLQDCTDPFYRGVLSVDYGPDQVLRNALDAAGINGGMGTLPIKTTMWIRDDGTVAVRYGYGADIETLLAA